MKIDFVSRYQGKVERGVENYAAELAEKLGRKSRVKILTSFWQLLPRFSPAVTSGQLPRSDLGRSDLKIIYPLNGYWQALGCRLYAWMTGAKLVVGGHAGIGRDDRWNLYMFPDLFIAFSQKGYEWARKVNPFVKIVKIPHGVNLEKFNSDVKPAKVDLERPIFVTAAHLVPYKRVDLTVKAVSKLTKGSLLVLGEGPMEKEIDELGNELLGNRGDKGDKGKERYLRLAVRHGQVAGYLRSGDVFTLVSEESEAFGLVYLEALACNLPVVATDDSLRRELIGDHAAIRLSAESRRAGAGIFVKNPVNSREYARCLEAAAKTDWGDKPVRQAGKFDWEKIASEYEKTFLRLNT